MERQSSPARSTASELNGGEGAGPSGRGAALGFGEALGPAYGERCGVRWLGTNELAENRGERDGDGLSEADTALVQTRCAKAQRQWEPREGHASCICPYVSVGVVSWIGTPCLCGYACTRAALDGGLHDTLVAAAA
jgi:hypothetical protein